jgi:hypothetical protein
METPDYTQIRYDRPSERVARITLTHGVRVDPNGARMIREGAKKTKAAAE